MQPFDEAGLVHLLLHPRQGAAVSTNQPRLQGGVGQPLQIPQEVVDGPARLLYGIEGQLAAKGQQDGVDKGGAHLED